jgi:hypothetical protein
LLATLLVVIVVVAGCGRDDFNNDPRPPIPAEIAPGDADTLKVDMKTGDYEASVDGFAVAPFSFTVGPERPSGQNDLLLP